MTDSESIRTDGTRVNNLLDQLTRALDSDLALDFQHQDLYFAWQNPRTLWGERDVLLRIHTNTELVRVLDELRL